MKQRLYISESLENTDKGRNVAKELKTLGSDSSLEMEVSVIPNLLNRKNEWCRDYMPVKAADGTLILFRYYPSYLRGSLSNLKTIPDQPYLCDNLSLKYKVSEIILDGGAIEICEGSGIVSDRVFRDNYDVWKQDEKGLLLKLKDELRLSKLFVIPQHPYDFTGHVDGLVRFINKKKVLINDLSSEFRMMKGDKNLYRKKLIDQWYYSFKMSLNNAGLGWEELVCATDFDKPSSDAYGIYMNFLLLEKIVVVPGFESELDIKARDHLEYYYERKSITIQATELAKKGGILNCVTWQSFV